MSGLTTLDDLPLVMTADDVAPVLDKSPNRVRRMIAAGQLDHVVVVVGGNKRISRYLLEQWLRGELPDP